LALLLATTDSFAQEKAATEKGGPFETFLGLCCVCTSGLICIGIIGGGVYLIIRMTRSKPVEPLDVSAPATHEKFGLRFQHPRSWKPKHDVPDGMCIIPEGPLLFLCIQRMPNADGYINAFKEESKQSQTPLTPEDFDRLATLSAIGYGATLGAGLVKLV